MRQCRVPSNSSFQIGDVNVEIKESQYQACIKMLSGAIEAFNQAISGMKRKEDPGQLRRRIEEGEGLVKKAKRELRIA